MTHANKLKQAWKNTAPDEVVSPYMTCKFHDSRWELQPEGDQPVDDLIESLSANGTTPEHVVLNTCAFCGHINLDPQGFQSWEKDMGWDACSNPYCGAI